MIRIRAPYATPVLRRSAVRVGADPDLWVAVSTDASRADVETKQALGVGDVVRFTAQYGIRPKDDDSNLVVLRGKIVAPRTPALPDSYGVQATEVVKTWRLDPTVSTPFAGQVFLVAPWSIAAVEDATAMTPSGTLETYSTSESPPPEITTRETMGTAPQTTEEESSSSGVVIWTVVMVVAAFGALALTMLHLAEKKV